MIKVFHSYQLKTPPGVETDWGFVEAKHFISIAPDQYVGWERSTEEDLKELRASSEHYQLFLDTNQHADLVTLGVVEADYFANVLRGEICELIKAHQDTLNNATIVVDARIWDADAPARENIQGAINYFDSLKNENNRITWTLGNNKPYDASIDDLRKVATEIAKRKSHLHTIKTQKCAELTGQTYDELKTYDVEAGWE